VRAAYSQVFDEMGEDALSAERDVLTNWFRASDKTSALVGQRQASTFRTLVALAGHGDAPANRASSPKKAVDPSTAASKVTAKKPSTSTAAGDKAPPAHARKDQGDSNTISTSDVGLTVRIEVNLPPGGDADTYDAIFASIKKHLMA
jgi:hypothetical protein